jgi:L-iditol 2-dehydrogenase
MNTKIPKSMRALVLPEAGKFGIRDVSVPVPGEQEVLCRIRAVAICGTDPEVIHGNLAGNWPNTYPFIPGHEWAGEVVALGKNVSGFKVGDRVAGEAWKGCGHCANCVAGKYNLCMNYGITETGMRHYGFRHQGAYAQYNAYSIKAIHKMPSHMTFKEGSLVDTAGVGAHATELTGITRGGTVAVLGPGPIGLLTMRMAKLMGAARIIAIGRGSRLEAAGRLVADELVNFEDEDPVEAVRAITNGLGVNEAFEASGAEGTFNQAVRMVREGGKVALCGVPDKSIQEKLPFWHICRSELGIFGVKANPNVSEAVVSLIGSGQLVVKDLITHVFSLEDFAEALDTFEERKEGAVKVVVEPNGPED